jgi:hypothetical protein
MGEAKRKKEQLIALAIKQFARWDFPATEAEAQAVAEIQKLPEIVVKRYPNDALRYMRMKPSECHANARFMETNDPEKKCRQITGYWPQAGNYVLHSVVERDGEIFCVTPLMIDGPDHFPFIPDPDIEWREENGFNVPYRKGLVVEPGLRIDPVENKRIAEVILGRIEAGMDPLRAGEPPF